MYILIGLEGHFRRYHPSIYGRVECAKLKLLNGYSDFETDKKGVYANSEVKSSKLKFESTIRKGSDTVLCMASVLSRDFVVDKEAGVLTESANYSDIAGYSFHAELSSFDYTANASNLYDGLEKRLDEFVREESENSKVIGVFDDITFYVSGKTSWNYIDGVNYINLTILRGDLVLGVYRINLGDKRRCNCKSVKAVDFRYEGKDLVYTLEMEHRGNTYRLSDLRLCRG